MLNFFLFFSQNSQIVQSFAHSGPIQSKTVQKCPKNMKNAQFFFLLLSQNSQKVQNFAHSGPIQSENVQKSPQNEKMLNCFLIFLSQQPKNSKICAQWSNLVKSCSKMSKKRKNAQFLFLLLSQNGQKLQKFAHSGPIQSKNVQKCPKNERGAKNSQKSQ